MSKRNSKKRVWGPGLVIVILLILLVAEFCGLLWVTKLLPMHMLISAAIVMLTLVLIIGLLTGNLRKKLRFVFGAILAIMMVAALVLGNLYVIQTYNTLTRISDVNTKMSAIGVYVRANDPAETIEDAKDYTFGTLQGLDEENTTQAVNQIIAETGQSIQLMSQPGLTEMIDALRDGTCQAIILNHAYLPLLQDIEGYEDAESEMREISITEVEETLAADDVVDEEVINNDVMRLYLSGVDTRSNRLENSRSDVNIIATINMQTHQVLLISTPRDYFVPLSISNGVPDKLTHAGIYGIDVSMDTLGMLYNTDVKNYFRVNFVGFVKLIDALGGVTVYSDYDFTSDDDFHYNQGWNDVNGEEALSFARERHAFAEGDRQRGKDQMAVIEAVIKKATSPELLRNYSQIMASAEGSFDTNLSYSTIAELVRKQLNSNEPYTVFRYSVDGTGGNEKPYSMSANAYVMIPDQATVDKAIQLMTRMNNNEVLTQQDVEGTAADETEVTEETSEIAE